MKYYFPLSIAISLVLGGCQSTPFQSEKKQQKVALVENTATPAEVSLALLSDEASSVMHPIADVEFSVSDEGKISDDLWEHIQTKMHFDIPQNQRVVSQRNWYVKHASYFDRVAKRAEPFLFYIVQELEANDVPVELALLPIVESAFDPFAYSHGRASGMWQFVPGTGTRFGMKQNWWYDGRRDVIASTQGAIKYLKYLNKFFDGDWLLALAAYNSGEGRVRNAVKNNARKNKPTDYWSLDLPRETEAYVPKLLALADIIKRPADFGIDLYDIQNKAVISQVEIGSQLDLAKAAQLAELSLAELQHLNPGFNRWATDPDGPHYLVVPNNKIEKFRAGLNKLSKKDRLAWQRYKIKSGDSLSHIAKKFNTTTALIQQVNQINGSQIRAGKHLLIPVATQALDQYIFSQEQRIAKKQSKSYNGTKLTHKVKSGDNLWDLGQTYKVSSKEIAKWNGMAPRDTLKIGQKLVIWQAKKMPHNSKQSIEQAIMRNITYKVRRGDSFARIADKFNVSIKDIERWNSLNSRKYLQPGQLLKLSVDVTNSI